MCAKRRFRSACSFVESKVSLSGQWRLKAACADAQAALSLRWPLIPESTISHVVELSCVSRENHQWIQYFVNKWWSDLQQRNTSFHYRLPVFKLQPERRTVLDQGNQSLCQSYSMAISWFFCYVHIFLRNNYEKYGCFKNGRKHI